MARNFNGSSDVLVCSAGGLTGIDGGPITLVAILKLGDTTNGAVINLRTSGGTLVAQFNVDAGTYYFESSGFQSMGTASTADNWHLIAMTKATGTATPRAHKYVYDTNTWTHTNAGGTMGDAGAMGAGGTTQIGRYQGTSEYLNADIAVAGVWGRELSDAEVEQLAFHLNGWFAAAPDALWLLDQQATGQAVVDLTGGGANQSSLTGTAVSSVSVPVFSYGDAVYASTVVAAGGTTFTQTVSGSVTPAGSLVRQTGKRAAGSVTPVGALVKQLQRAVAGATSPSAVLLKLAGRLLAGSSTPTGALTSVRTRLLAVAGNLTPSGSLVRQVAKLAAGNTVPSGGLIKQLNRLLSGSVTPTSSMANIRTRLIAITGAIAPSGTAARLAAKAVAGATAPVGQAARGTSKSFTGVITPTGAVASARTRLLTLAGSIVGSGTLIKQCRRTVSGTLAPAAAVFRVISRSLSGNVSPSGAALKLLGRFLGGGAVPTGAVTPETNPAIVVWPPSADPPVVQHLYTADAPVVEALYSADPPVID